MNNIIIDESADDGRNFDVDATNYDNYFRQQVQKGLDDKSPSLSTLEARQRIDAALASLLNKSETK